MFSTLIIITLDIRILLQINHFFLSFPFPPVPIFLLHFPLFQSPFPFSKPFLSWPFPIFQFQSNPFISCPFQSKSFLFRFHLLSFFYSTFPPLSSFLSLFNSFLYIRSLYFPLFHSFPLSRPFINYSFHPLLFFSPLHSFFPSPFKSFLCFSLDPTSSVLSFFIPVFFPHSINQSLSFYSPTLNFLFPFQTPNFLPFLIFTLPNSLPVPLIFLPFLPYWTWILTLGKGIQSLATNSVSLYLCIQMSRTLNISNFEFC